MSVKPHCSNHFCKRTYENSLKLRGFIRDLVIFFIKSIRRIIRLLLIDWVAGFDKWDYIIDRWGLFNPPGIGPFDKDPDDDIPFRGFEEDPEE